MKLLLVLIIFMGTGAIQATAQTSLCPEDLICIEYEDHIIDIDPECGVVQSIVIEEYLVRQTSLSGTTESFGLKGVVVASNAGEFSVIGEFSGPAEDTLSGIRFGDVGCLTWEVENESD